MLKLVVLCAIPDSFIITSKNKMKTSHYPLWLIVQCQGHSLFSAWRSLLCIITVFYSYTNIKLKHQINPLTILINSPISRESPVQTHINTHTHKHTLCPLPVPSPGCLGDSWAGDPISLHTNRAVGLAGGRSLGSLSPSSNQNREWQLIFFFFLSQDSA